MSTPMTLRLQDVVKTRLDKLADATQRSKLLSPPRRSTSTSRTTSGKSAISRRL